MNSDRVERRRPNRLGIASKFKEKRPTAIFLRNDLTQPSRTTPRPQNSAQARIIEKEKVLTNMQEHLAHIQELEAERAAKHQEKRDKAKQKVVISVFNCASIWGLSRSERCVSVYTRSCVSLGGPARVSVPSSRGAVARGVTTTCRRRDAPHNSH